MFDVSSLETLRNDLAWSCWAIQTCKAERHNVRLLGRVPASVAFGDEGRTRDGIEFRFDLLLRYCRLQHKKPSTCAQLQGFLDSESR